MLLLQNHILTINSMSKPICIRPHHLLDIIRNWGNNIKMEGHPYGHAQNIISRQLLSNRLAILKLVNENDDLCTPCCHLENGICKDVLPQLEERTLKQEYNDQLDANLFDYLQLADGQEIKFIDFVRLAHSKMPNIVDHCLHPKEDFNFRKNGLERGCSLILGSS